VPATLPQLANDAVLDVRPGDQAAATQVEEWLQAYATSRDPQLREQIILAYLGMADRLADPASRPPLLAITRGCALYYA
jgi:hypothetical protein